MSALRSAPLHMAAGFLLMGGWAWFANRGHEWPAPLRAALVQGAATALTTLALKRVVDWTSARTRGCAQLLLPVLAAWALSFCLLLAFHLSFGTPELWGTLLIPNLVATIYAALYAAALRRV